MAAGREKREGKGREEDMNERYTVGSLDARMGRSSQESIFMATNNARGTWVTEHYGGRLMERGQKTHATGRDGNRAT